MILILDELHRDEVEIEEARSPRIDVHAILRIPGLSLCDNQPGLVSGISINC